MKMYVHALSGVNPMCAAPAPAGRAPVPDSPPTIDDADSDAFCIGVESTIFTAKTPEELREATKFLDEEMDANGGEAPLRSPAKWKRGLRDYLVARSRRARPRCIAPVVMIGRQRVSGRFRRTHRRPARFAARSTSSDDGGGGEGPPPIIRCRPFLLLAERGRAR